MIPRKALDLILNAEGIDQPSKWPGGLSGITLGYGYDLGYETNFKLDWYQHLSSAEIQTLSTALFKRGPAAQHVAPAFSSITIAPEASLDVFLTKSLPHYEYETRVALPGVDKLPLLAFGALVSLFYNRGSDMTGPRRLEMRAIRSVIADYANGRTSLTNCLKEIAGQLRSMKHLWAGQGLNGLLTRREAEAELVEQSAQANPSA